MKLLARMLGVAALLVASACGDGLTDPDDEEDNVFTANVQGAGFVGENFSNFVLTGNRLSFWVSQVVAGGDTHRFEFSLEPVNGPGTFPVGGGNASRPAHVEETVQIERETQVTSVRSSLELSSNAPGPAAVVADQSDVQVAGMIKPTLHSAGNSGAAAEVPPVRIPGL